MLPYRRHRFAELKTYHVDSTYFAAASVWQHGNSWRSIITLTLLW